MNLWGSRVRDGEGDSQGVWDGHVHTATFKTDNRTYCAAHETHAQPYMALGWEGSLGENGYMYVYG